MNAVAGGYSNGLKALLQTAKRDAAAILRRVLPLERNIVLPARMVAILILYHSFHFTPWIRSVSTSLEVGVETVISMYWIYAGATLVGSALLLLARWLPATLIRWTVLTEWLLDAIFLSGLTLITGGYDSFAYWIFIVLIIRNSIGEPASITQVLVNLFTVGGYLLAGISDISLAATLDEHSRMVLGLNPATATPDVLFVRTLLLLLVASCSYGVELMRNRQLLAEQEAREFALRENRLRSAGRLAAEIAHQLKNPLAIINNATFSLQRSVEKKGAEPDGHIQIIREEVERADRILTQVMGYAQLSEGRVERLHPAQMLDAAIEEVFPAGMNTLIRLERDYGRNVHHVMMQPGHLRQILVNLLQNAREAMGDSGLIRVEARTLPDQSVEIVISDSGPGIPADKRERVFESYFTTKDKGTGLGLAIVRNNVELYGGRIGVDSELGKGTRFRLNLPTRLPWHLES